jgi:hypothetical protein
VDEEWRSVLKYVDVKDLKTLQNTDENYCHRFILPTLENSDYVKLIKPSVPIIADEYNLPLVANEEFARWFGFMMGDVGKLQLDSDDKKRIPSWVYQSPRSVQEAFIEGYLDADGYNRKIKNCLNESIKLGCCNKRLIEDFKELIHRLGWDVDLVRKHVCVDDIITWSLNFKKVDSPNTERILGIEEVKEDLVYDIGVDSDEHNFIVNGIPVHNTRAPEKRMFRVPVGNLPPKEREQYIQTIARRFKKHKFIDPATGAVDEKYAPHIQDDDYWVPVTGDGNGVEVETLQGAENLDAIADIEYFKKKMISALKIPFHRVGIGESEGDPGKSIASQSPEFSKAVQWVQDQVIVGIKKAVLVHLSLRNYSIDDMKNFELGMTSASAIDELYRIETWASRVDIMGGIKELGFFPDEWIIEHFTDMTADELELINKMKKIKGDEEEADEEGEEEFFDSYDKLSGKMLLNEIKDLKSIIKEDKFKNSSHKSLTKMINENEFDGLDQYKLGLDYDLDKEHNEAKVLVESMLNEDFPFLIDESN